MKYFLPSRITVTSSFVDKALTTEAPTPCKPPETLYPPPPNLPPAWRTVKTVSSAGRPVFSWISTGIPRPSSWTVTLPSSLIVTSILVAKPASRSSILLSIISHTKWCNPWELVEPIYIPGRLRTASRPPKTWIWLALYLSASFSYFLTLSRFSFDLSAI